MRHRGSCRWGTVPERAIRGSNGGLLLPCRLLFTNRRGHRHDCTLTRNGLTAHVATRISLFSKSHDCGQVVAHPSTRPQWTASDSSSEGRFSFQIRLCSWSHLRVASALTGDRDHECRERIEKVQARLRREIDRQGERSRQAEKCRHELEEARERCRGDRDRDHNRDNH
jgi:hypothetical protein